MRLAALAITVLLAAACSGRAHVANGRFYAPHDAFDVEVPRFPPKTLSVHPLETQSSFSEFEQSVGFQVRFGDMHRIERFKTGSTHFAVDRSLPPERQLAEVEAEYSGFLKANGFEEQTVLDRRIERIGGNDVLLEAHAIGDGEDTYYRGVAFVITPHFVTVIQHSNPKYTERDAPAILAELARFYATLHVGET